VRLDDDGDDDDGLRDWVDWLDIVAVAVLRG
jgi:hypothetical protein